MSTFSRNLTMKIHSNHDGSHTFALFRSHKAKRERSIAFTVTYSVHGAQETKYFIYFFYHQVHRYIFTPIWGDEAITCKPGVDGKTAHSGNVSVKGNLLNKDCERNKKIGANL